MTQLPRRTLMAAAAACAALPHLSLAATPRAIKWEDQIPPGVPHSEIIIQGEVDEANDRWLSEFDENATKLNKKLHGAYIKMPDYVLPIDMSTAGMTNFLMVPYVRACVHTPSPPGNQLVFVDTKEARPSDKMREPVWVTGRMHYELQSTMIEDIGYALSAELIEVYEW